MHALEDLENSTDINNNGDVKFIIRSYHDLNAQSWPLFSIPSMSAHIHFSAFWTETLHSGPLRTWLDDVGSPSQPDSRNGTREDLREKSTHRQAPSIQCVGNKQDSQATY